MMTADDAVVTDDNSPKIMPMELETVDSVEGDPCGTGTVEDVL